MAADMWSLGVVLYAMLAQGKCPFEHTLDHILIRDVTQGHYDFDDEIWEDVPEKAKTLVENLLKPAVSTSAATVATIDFRHQTPSQPSVPCDVHIFHSAPVVSAAVYLFPERFPVQPCSGVLYSSRQFVCLGPYDPVEQPPLYMHHS
eukprot:gene16733-19839_t